MTHLGSLLCLGGCGNNESAKHLFFECDVFSNLSPAVTKWLKIYTAFSVENSYLFNKETHKCFFAIWVACWLIWKERNN
jgi:hypothetical protein